MVFLNGRPREVNITYVLTIQYRHRAAIARPCVVVQLSQSAAAAEIDLRAKTGRPARFEQNLINLRVLGAAVRKTEIIVGGHCLWRID